MQFYRHLDYSCILILTPLINFSLSLQVEPKFFACRVMFSLVWESKVGFSIKAFTKIHMWFFTYSSTQKVSDVIQAHHGNSSKFWHSLVTIMFYFPLGKKKTKPPKPRVVFPTGEILTYLKRLHSDSVFIFLFHNFNDFSHQLISYVINMPATLRENGTKDLVVIPLKKKKYEYLFKTSKALSLQH